jgi:flagellar basal body rod protein FlgF
MIALARQFEMQMKLLQTAESNEQRVSDHVIRQYEGANRQLHPI